MSRKRRFLGVILLAAVIAAAAVPVSFAQNSVPLKVTLLFDVGGRGDGGFNDSAFRGLEKAVKELGVRAVYREPAGSLDRAAALNEAAASDADMIIGVGFIFTDPMNELAVKYPAKKFACVDYGIRTDDQGRIRPVPDNLDAIVFREEEGAYLVGALAALKSGTGTIGFLGGMNSPIIRRFQSGYAAGARSVRPDIRILSEFTGITGRAFNNPDKGYWLSNRMYGKGADVIFHAAGATGEGLFRAAKKRHMWAIGVDIDQSAQAPGLVLTSMIKRVDVAVFDSVRASASGNFSGGVHSFGLKENGVGFVYDDQNKPLIPENVYEKVQALQQGIVSGKWAVPAAQERPLLLKKDLRDMLTQLKEEIKDALIRLDGGMKRSAGKLSSGMLLSGDRARAVLRELYGENPYLIDCAAVSARGIIQAIEPNGFGSSEGADIGAQAHWLKLVQTGKPLLSDVFLSQEGTAAVALQHPIFLPSHRLGGAVSALFSPEKLLGRIIEPVSAALPVDIFLMQTDGRMIYDVDPSQIGRNVFEDPLYKPFPELLALAKKVAAQKRGTGEYRFYRKNGEPPVTKLAYWKTVGMYGTDWRIVVTCASDNIDR